MPIDSALVAARLGKPGDLRHPVTDRDQKHPTVSAATQANTRDLAKWHVDHAAHSQPVLVRLTVFHHGRGSLWTSTRTHNHYLMIFDHLVGEREQLRRHSRPSALGRLEVDHQLELGRWWA